MSKNVVLAGIASYGIGPAVQILSHFHIPNYSHFGSRFL